MMAKPSEMTCSNFRGWVLFFCGVCMGLADLVPGISGGTIAFILGFYQPLLESLKTLNWSAFQHLFKGRWHLFAQEVAWKFLLTLIAGMALAFICLANLFHFILAHEVYRIYLYATFFGLVLASFVFCMRKMQAWNSKMLLGLCAGALIAYLLTETTLTRGSEGNYAVPLQLEAGTVRLRNYDSEYHLLTDLSAQSLGVLLAQGLLQDTTPVYNKQHVLIGLVGELVVPCRVTFFNGWLVMCGALAICALLLPGISGSYILTLLGVYPMVMEAVVDFITSLKHFSFNGEAFVVLWSIGLGIVIGAIGFARVVSWVLRDYPDLSLSLLSGFMIGAIRSVWPFWSYEYIVAPLKLYKGPQLIALHPFLPPWDSPLVWQAIFCAITAFALFFTLEVFVQRKRQLAK
jgi:putative membrane protein